MKLLLILLAKPLLALSGTSALFLARSSGEFRAVEAELRGEAGAEAGAIIGGRLGLEPELAPAPEADPAPEPEADDKVEVEKK